uniref:Serine/threonine-protein kinase mos n=1 Tax=Cyanistes caeruleus TaxID=156563 RepID=A0A8C0UYV4_CYACU
MGTVWLEAAEGCPGEGWTRRLPPRLSWYSIDWDQLCLLQPLGSGGFGSVYKATYHGATVAVKQVKKSSKNRLASRQSFWAELNVAQLQHDNVVLKDFSNTFGNPKGTYQSVPYLHAVSAPKEFQYNPTVQL